VIRASVSLLGIAALLLLPGFVSAAPVSGLRGTVVVDPNRPVCIEGRPCSAPAAGVVLRFSRNDRVVTRTRTRADGTYRVILTPGRYLVSLAKARGPTSIAPHTVRVTAGRMTLRDFTIDTGIQ
jgi:hypothetical protein